MNYNYYSNTGQNYSPYSQTSNQSSYYSSQNDNRLIGGGGFLGPFILGGITGGLLAPAFSGGYGYGNRPCCPVYYAPYPYYGPYYR
jgi:hypothetical protein